MTIDLPSGQRHVDETGYLKDLADADFVTALSATIGAESQTVVPPIVDASMGRAVQPLLAYNDFTTKPDGAVQGTVADSGQTWNGTGATPPTVVSGGLQSTGTGYAWLTCDEPVAELQVELEYTGTGTNQTCTLALSPDPGVIANLLHFNVNPTGFDLTFMVDSNWSTTDQPPYAMNWDAPMVNGETYTVALAVAGDVVQITGPNGETLTVQDSRALLTQGANFFVEPGGSAAGRYARVKRVAALGAPTVALTKAATQVGRGRDSSGRAVGNRWSGFEASIGRGPTSGSPALVLGPQYVRVTLAQDAAVGATTITTTEPIPTGAYLTATGDNLGLLDPNGPNEEQITFSGNPGATYPFTRTVAALTKAHPAGTQVYCRCSRFVEISYNPVSQTFTLPNQTAVNGNLYLGTNLDAALQRGAADLIQTGTGDSIAIRSGAWNSGHLLLGAYHLWVDATGALRIKNGAPTSDTDGATVGSQV